ncbi:MAG: hypothetical protein QME62_04820 [Armatimonadota bacterium]|nr:hypothetical protein [Armatimonadota bacterium]
MITVAAGTRPPATTLNHISFLIKSIPSAWDRVNTRKAADALLMVSTWALNKAGVGMTQKFGKLILTNSPRDRKHPAK